MSYTHIVNVLFESELILNVIYDASATFKLIVGIHDMTASQSLKGRTKNAAPECHTPIILISSRYYLGSFAA